MACRSPALAAARLARSLQSPPPPSSPIRLLPSSSALARSSRRSFTTTTRALEDDEVFLKQPETSLEQGQPPPRWSRTPSRMKAPISLNNPRGPERRWECNEDPELLNRTLRTVLGERGDKLLTDEVKWLAVTHKSFDQGRRGFNDRLAFLGRQIVSLQVSLGLLQNANAPNQLPPDEYADMREPFPHPSADLLPRLTAGARDEILDPHHVAKLASRMGLLKVVRWKPRDMRNLVLSGSELVLAQALYAIVGAVALQRGGEVAVRVVREQLLGPLGVGS